MNNLRQLANQKPMFQRQFPVIDRTMYDKLPQMSTDKHIRANLHRLKDELAGLRQSAKADQKPVALDQQSVGRLSRMDSLQMQAMDQARDARRLLEIKRIDAALHRLEEGEYGYCVRCGTQIAKERLEQDPAAPFCVGCA